MKATESQIDECYRIILRVVSLREQLEKAQKELNELLANRRYE